MEIIVKNLKSYEDITLNLPMDSNLLKEKLGLAEYVIVSAEGLPVNDYESIIDISQ